MLLWVSAGAPSLAAEIPTRVRLRGLSINLEKREVLLGHGALGLRYFPDTATSVLERGPELRLLMTAGVASYAVSGRDMRSLNRADLVLEKGRPGSFDNGYAGVSGLYRHSDGVLYAFYHSEDQENMPEVGPGVPGFYARVCLAGSKDGGKSFQKLGPVIESAQKKTPGGMPDQGLGELCLSPDSSGRYLLCYYVDHSRIEDRGVQIFLARADVTEGPPLPGSWKKWRNGDFRESGLGGLDSPVVTALPWGADAAFPQVTWMPKLGLYLMLYNINAWREYAGHDATLIPEKSGIYAATSVDGIKWSEPQRLISAFSVAVAHKEVAWHPSLILDDEKGLDGWLVYAWTPRWHHEHLGGIPHHLVGRRVRLDKISTP